MKEVLERLKNKKALKIGFLVTFILVACALLFALCGQNKANQSGQLDKDVSTMSDSVGGEASPGPSATPDATSSPTPSASPALMEDGNGVKPGEQGKETAAGSAGDTAKKEQENGTGKDASQAVSEDAKANPQGASTPEPEKSQAEQKQEATPGPSERPFHGDSSNRLSPEQRKARTAESLQKLVSDGTITEAQSEKIAEALSGQGTGRSSDGQRQNPLDSLVADGTITKTQSDAVLKAMMTRTRGSQQSN